MRCCLFDVLRVVICLFCLFVCLLSGFACDASLCVVCLIVVVRCCLLLCCLSVVTGLMCVLRLFAVAVVCALLFVCCLLCGYLFVFVCLFVVWF